MARGHPADAMLARRIVRGGYRTAGDSIIPETPEYDGNLTGDLAQVPAGKTFKAGPIRLPVGAAEGAHRGTGIEHMADNARREAARMPKAQTGELAEDLVRQAVDVLRGVKEVHHDGSKFIFPNPLMKQAVVAAWRGDHYGIVTVRPYSNAQSLWGNPERVGRLTFPTRDAAATSPSIAVARESTPHPDRLGLEVASERFDVNTDKPKSAPQVTVKKRRTMQAPPPLSRDAAPTAAGRPSIAPPPRVGDREAERQWVRDTATALRAYADALTGAANPVVPGRVEHSGSAAGPSSYFKIGQQEVRVSLHSKGAHNSQFYLPVFDRESAERVMGVIERAAADFAEKKAGGRNVYLSRARALPSTATWAQQPNQMTPAQRADALIHRSARSAQPLDVVSRAITRATGVEWATKKLGGIVSGAFGRFTPESVKAGLVSDYGLDPRVRDERVLMQARQQVQLRKAGQMIDSLASLTRDESAAAYRWMNETDPQAMVRGMDELPEGLADPYAVRRRQRIADASLLNHRSPRRLMHPSTIR